MWKKPNVLCPGRGYSVWEATARNLATGRSATAAGASAPALRRSAMPRVPCPGKEAPTPERPLAYPQQLRCLQPARIATLVTIQKVLKTHHPDFLVNPCPSHPRPRYTNPLERIQNRILRALSNPVNSHASYTQKIAQLSILLEPCTLPQEQDPEIGEPALGPPGAQACRGGLVSGPGKERQPSWTTSSSSL